MEIKTKFNVGDFVVFIFERDIKSGNVSKIRTNTMKNSLGEIYTYVEYTISFSLEGSLYHEAIREEHLFSSREDLLKSL